jgi:hypothetical protein
MRWAIGAIAAAFCATVLLPGVASAHEADLTGEATCRAFDGSWSINWTLTTTNTPSNRELDGFDDTGFDTGSNDTTESVDQGTINVIDGNVAPDLTLGDFGLANNDGIVGNGSADATTDYAGSDTPNATIYAEGRVQWTPTSGGNNSQTAVEQNVRSNDVESPGFCIVTICEDGNPGVEAPVNEAADTGDCDPVRVCVDGQNFLVTEFEQAEEDLDTGDCPGFEETPPPPTTTTITTTTTLPPAAPVEPAAEVLPAALPATGMGPGETSSGFSWGAAAAVVLLGLGGGTALLARRRVS